MTAAAIDVPLRIDWLALDQDASRPHPDICPDPPRRPMPIDTDVIRRNAAALRGACTDDTLPTSATATLALASAADVPGLLAACEDLQRRVRAAQHLLAQARAETDPGWLGVLVCNVDLALGSSVDATVEAVPA